MATKIKVGTHPHTGSVQTLNGLNVLTNNYGVYTDVIPTEKTYRRNLECVDKNWYVEIPTFKEFASQTTVLGVDSHAAYDDGTSVLYTSAVNGSNHLTISNVASMISSELEANSIVLSDEDGGKWKVTVDKTGALKTEKA
jgi:hypothetical protein